MTERFECDFVAKEFHEGTPWIAIQPLSGLYTLTGGLGFDLPPGTSLEQAKAIAKYLRDNIVRMAFTPNP